MSSAAIALIEVIERLPADSTLTLRNVSWAEYEALLENLGDASGLRISYDGGTLHVMTLSSEHESYSRLIEALVRLLSTKLRIRVLSFGSSTIKKAGPLCANDKGSEPDGCFYVQSAAAIGQSCTSTSAKTPRRISWWRSTSITSRYSSSRFTPRSAFPRSGASTERRS